MPAANPPPPSPTVTSVSGTTLVVASPTVPDRTPALPSETVTAPDPTAPAKVPVPTATAVETEVPVGQPVRLVIPAIGVDAPVESVGKDSEGQMESPTDAGSVGWYQPGSRPGMVGSAVMAGHLDDALLQPAVFWGLAELQAGDSVMVIDENGIEYEFLVSDTEVYLYNQAPIAKIFGSDGTSTLQLITCRGIWDKDARNYNERLVVYTRLAP